MFCLLSSVLKHDSGDKITTNNHTVNDPLYLFLWVIFWRMSISYTCNGGHIKQLKCYPLLFSCCWWEASAKEAVVNVDKSSSCKHFQFFLKVGGLLFFFCLIKYNDFLFPLLSWTLLSKCMCSTYTSNFVAHLGIYILIMMFFPKSGCEVQLFLWFTVTVVSQCHVESWIQATAGNDHTLWPSF